ncbi:MAG: lipopolysaccharide biosynthesis protein [bacterium]|nr:lipopolysaccharide biosynthesis protein [bacterium]
MSADWLRQRQAFVPVAAANGSIGQQVASGGFWSGLSVASETVLQTVRTIIFARLLAPEDFGIVALATIFTQFVFIFANFGFSASIIYRRDIDRDDLSVCWWGNIGIDTSAALICCIIAFFSSRTADNPVTAHIICIMAAQFLFTSVGSVNNALMRRVFMFKEITIVNIATTVVAFAIALGLILYRDAGVYGLAIGAVSGSVLRSLLNFYFVPWLPSFRFSWSRLRGHFEYGGWFLGVQLVTFANGNLDRTVVGTYLDTAQLGYFEYASNIPLSISTRLSQVLNSVLFPAISSLQYDLDQLGDLLRKVYRYNAFIIFPLLVGIGLVAPDFVRVAYGEQWMVIVEPLRFFCLYGLLRIFINPYHALCNGLGMPRLPFKWTLIYLPLNIALVYLGIRYYGLTGAVVVRLAVPIFMTVTLGREIFKHARIPLGSILASALPATLCCVVMAAVILAATPALNTLVASPLLRLLAKVGLGILVYGIAFALLFGDDRRFIQRQILKMAGRT